MLHRLQSWLQRNSPRNARDFASKISRGISDRLSNWRAGSAATSETAALAGLQADNPHRRWESAAILARSAHRSEEAIEALTRALADPEEFVRWQAAQALAAQDPGHVFPALTTALADREPSRRAGAAEAMGYLGGEAASVTLCKHLGDPDPDVRAAVAAGLQSLADPTSVSCLLPYLSDEVPDVRRAVAGALGRIASPSTAKPIAAALSQSGQPLLVRRALAAALVRATHPDARRALLAALADPDPQVRGYAAEALGQLGDETVYAALREAQSDDGALLDGTVGDQARRALTMLERRGRASVTTPLPTEEEAIRQPPQDPRNFADLQQSREGEGLLPASHPQAEEKANE